MPYTITTRDGITLRNIPDDVGPDSLELKQRVQRIRETTPERTGAALVPTAAEARGEGYTPPASTAQPEPGLIDRAIGTGEAALTAVTSIPGGAVGMVGGAIKGTAQQILNGQFGTPQASNLIEQAAAQGAQALTYAPRGAEGQRQAGVLGEGMQQLIPVMGLTPQLGALARGAAPAGMAARTGAAAVLDKAQTAVPAAARAVAAKVAPASAQEAPGRFGSVGAAGATQSAERAATAGALPVPIQLTRGQSTRNFEQLRFEGETAKDPSLGAPLRDRAATQNRQLSQNFEAMIDETGAKATTATEAGRTVDSALVSAAAQKKGEYRAAYKAAEAAGQMEDPVPMQPVVDFLKENASANAPELAGGSLGIAQRELVRLGGAEVVNGELVARDLPLKNVELVRRQIGNAINATPDNPTNVRMGVMLRELIDTQTDGMGGDLYKTARASRRRYAQLFEDNAIVRDLLRTRRGTSDRQVALEDVVRRTVLNGDRASLGMLRRTLQVAGGEEGAQAWRELQGATVRHLLDESTKGVGTDTAGNPIFSAAKLNNAVRAMDVDGRLDFMLTKKGAQTVRDLNEIAKVVMTMPPGAVNTSHTASVLLAALTEAGVSGSITGLPIPVLSGLRALSVHVKDRRVRQRVQEALRSGMAEQAKAAAPKTKPNKTVH